jgi:putative FmdB family regulatory protein
MPRYEYACSACGAELELEQRISEDPIRRCPECEKDTLERLISTSNFALKGGGWYADGYGSAASKSGKSGGEAAPAAAPKPEPKPTGSTD